MTTLQDLPNGTKIYYTGDMANAEDFGVVIEQSTNKWGDQVDIRLDDGRIFKGVSPLNFGGLGRRFVLRTEYDAERQAKIDAFVNRSK